MRVRAGDLVDEIARGGGLGGGQDLAVAALPRAFRGARRARLPSATHRRGDVAQQTDRHLAVEIDVLDELHELRIRRRHRQTDERRIPHAPGFAVLVARPRGLNGFDLNVGADVGPCAMRAQCRAGDGRLPRTRCS